MWGGLLLGFLPMLRGQFMGGKKEMEKERDLALRGSDLFLQQGVHTTSK
jgi:hypothetical protein